MRDGQGCTATPRSGVPLAALAALALLLGSACSPPRPLSRSHRAVPCASCHTSRLRQSPDRARCLACHAPIASRAAAHKGLHGAGEGLSQPCGRCHVEHRGEDLSGWQKGEEEFRKDHEQVTGFALSEAHARPKCGACHKDSTAGRRSYLAASRACESCHGLPHGPVREPLRDCQRCHTMSSFRPLRKERQFDHDRDTPFQLTGDHRVVGCAGRCHGSKPPKFRLDSERATDCAGCHKEKSPHGGGFGAEPCRTCHEVTRGWSSPLPFDHAARTGFALQKPHNKPCLSCHRKELTAAPQPDCAGCHRSKHRDRFAAQGACSTCHAPPKWQVSVFDHGQKARFVLTANHTVQTLKECRSCHRGRSPSSFEDLRSLSGKGPSQKGFQVDCMGCHSHKTVHKGQFRSAQCLDCHELPGKEKIRTCLDRGSSTNMACLRRLSWIGHGPQSSFKLVGAHSLANIAEKCAACHRDPGAGFLKIPSGCASCHAGADRHKGSLGPQCERCHSYQTGTWRNTMAFNHQRTAFPLLGVHERTQCRRCHPSNDLAVRFKPRPTICGDAECHERDDAHKRTNGPSCGFPGCHDPRHGGWIIPKK